MSSRPGCSSVDGSSAPTGDARWETLYRSNRHLSAQSCRTRWGVALMSSGSTGRQSVFRRKPVDAFVTETRPDAEGAELASTIPVSGSSYSYTYATMGEIVAFGVAACLLLEYGVSAAAVSVGWGQYLNELLSDLFGFRIPGAINAAPGEGGFFNLPAIVLVTLCGLLLIRGVRESATANTIMVLIKLAILALFIVVGFTGFSGDNLEP